jgi:hypothetical protein
VLLICIAYLTAVMRIDRWFRKPLIDYAAQERRDGGIVVD